MFDCEVFWDLHMYRVSDFYQAVIIQRQDKGMYLPLNLWKVLQCIFKRYFCLLLSIRHWSIMRNTPIHHVIRWNQESSFIQHHVWLWHIYMLFLVWKAVLQRLHSLLIGQSSTQDDFSLVGAPSMMVHHSDAKLSIHNYLLIQSC